LQDKFHKFNLVGLTKKHLTGLVLTTTPLKVAKGGQFPHTNRGNGEVIEGNGTYREWSKINIFDLYKVANIFPRN